MQGMNFQPDDFAVPEMMRNQSSMCESMKEKKEQIEQVEKYSKNAEIISQDAFGINFLERVNSPSEEQKSNHDLRLSMD